MADKSGAIALIAARPFTYATRRLKPGDDFTTKRAVDAKLLVALGKATPKRIPGRIPAPPEHLARRLEQLDHDGDGKPGGSKSPAPSDDIRALREQYFKATGKRPFNGWDAAMLREKIANA